MVGEEERAEVRFVEDETLKYVLQRYRESHDYWHVLSGFKTTVLGEIALKWLEMLQTGMPSTILSSVVGPIRLPIEDKIKLATVYLPAVIQMHASLKVPLISVAYENHFEKDIDEFRRELGINIHKAL